MRKSRGRRESTGVVSGKLVLDHTCDRKGPPAKVIDESGDEPITCIYPTCSVYGVPQVFLTCERLSQ